MWSPDDLVNLNPLRLSLHVLVLTGLFSESTNTGVAVLPLGPLDRLLICSSVKGTYPQSMVLPLSINASVVALDVPKPQSALPVGLTVFSSSPNSRCAA